MAHLGFFTLDYACLLSILGVVFSYPSFSKKIVWVLVRFCPRSYTCLTLLYLSLGLTPLPPPLPFWHPLNPLPHNQPLLLLLVSFLSPSLF